MKRLTDEEYDAKLKSQGGGCGICGRKPKPESTRRFCLDHNHQSGLKRGLLCFICNGKLLGRLERFRSFASLRQIIGYLERYDPDNVLLRD